MRKYSNSEAMAMLEKNPKLKFESVGENGEFSLVVNKDGTVLLKDKDDCDRDFCIADQWELKQQQVPFMEAVKEWHSGKNIYCKVMGDEKTPIYYRHCNDPRIKNDLYDNNDRPICSNEILNGKWYIEEGEQYE